MELGASYRGVYSEKSKRPTPGRRRKKRKAATKRLPLGINLPLLCLFCFFFFFSLVYYETYSFYGKLGKGFRVHTRRKRLFCMLGLRGRVFGTSPPNDGGKTLRKGAHLFWNEGWEKGGAIRCLSATTIKRFPRVFSAAFELAGTRRGRRMRWWDEAMRSLDNLHKNKGPFADTLHLLW